MAGDFFHPEIRGRGLGGVHVDALYVDFHALNFVEKLEPLLFVAIGFLPYQQTRQ